MAITCGLVYRLTTFLMGGVRVNSLLLTVQKRFVPLLPPEESSNVNKEG